MFDLRADPGVLRPGRPRRRWNGTPTCSRTTATPGLVGRVPRGVRLGRDPGEFRVRGVQGLVEVVRPGRRRAEPAEVRARADAAGERGWLGARHQRPSTCGVLSVLEAAHRAARAGGVGRAAQQPRQRLRLSTRRPPLTGSGGVRRGLRASVGLSASRGSALRRVVG